MAAVNEGHDEKTSTGTGHSESSIKIEPRTPMEFRPIGSPHNVHEPGSQAVGPSSLRTLSRTRSNNGYGCDGADSVEEDRVAIENIPVPEKDPFEVSWEGGESDPLNPRGFALARKWVIVLIISASSICV